uniref:MHC class I-like antigen recognition-like domain-containing protein n=1 Tax=Chelonoidis abingdonii TaxID=106734 RepID=A0A8C0IP56_CHEAB
QRASAPKCLALCLLATDGLGSHSLQYFLTAVSEPGPGVPEFTVAGYVDGQRFVEYDSEAQQMQPRAPWMQETEPEVWERENHIHKVRQACFRGKVRSHMHLYNQSRGESAPARGQRGRGTGDMAGKRGDLEHCSGSQDSWVLSPALEGEWGLVR